eukprot:gene17236-biopygen3846
MRDGEKEFAAGARPEWIPKHTQCSVHCCKSASKGAMMVPFFCWTKGILSPARRKGCTCTFVSFRPTGPKEWSNGRNKPCLCQRASRRGAGCRERARFGGNGISRLLSSGGKDAHSCTQRMVREETESILSPVYSCLETEEGVKPETQGIAPPLPLGGAVLPPAAPRPGPHAVGRITPIPNTPPLDRRPGK